MVILGLEKVSLVDYEGNMCATVFTGGCNFNCSFCHNAMLVREQVKPLDEKEVLEYLNKRKGLLEAVTISGGEPTLQHDLEEFIIKVKALGYKIKLDTNGTRPEVLKDLINKGLLDFVAMDIKTCFNEYEKITNVKNELAKKVQESLKILKESKVEYELRTTLVNEFHNEETILKMAEELANENILYLQKFVDSGACIENNLSEVPKSDALKYKEILEKTIKTVVLRGYN